MTFVKCSIFCVTRRCIPTLTSTCMKELSVMKANLSLEESSTERSGTMSQVTTFVLVFHFVSNDEEGSKTVY